MKTTLRTVFGLLRLKSFKICDAIITAQSQPVANLSNNFHQMLPRSSRFERMSSFVDALDFIIPGSAYKLASFVYKTDYVPFHSPPVQLLNYGSGSSVFLLRGDKGATVLDKGATVLKVYRATIGRPTAQLLQVAHAYRKKYDTISSWYRGGPELLPSGHFVILNGPVLGKPAVAFCQPYVPGKINDFFRDFSDTELLSLIRENAQLWRQARFFLERTIEAYYRYRLCVDFLGRNNVAIVGNNGAQRMFILDNGICDMNRIKEKYPARFARIAQLISRMEALLAQVVLQTRPLVMG